MNSDTSVTVVPVFGNPHRGHCSRLAWTPALTGPLPVSVCTSGSSCDLLGVPWQPELVSLCPLHLCGLRSSGPCSTAHGEPPRRPPLSVALSEHRVLMKVDCQGTLGPSPPGSKCSLHTGRISLGDLKKCKLAYVFFDTFFNVEKYLDHEQREQVSLLRVSAGGGAG